jgi:hypothetical protein
MNHLAFNLRDVFTEADSGNQSGLVKHILGIELTLIELVLKVMSVSDNSGISRGLELMWKFMYFSPQRVLF